MKEFDFDELDKAVNSLMGDVNKPAVSPAPEPATASPVSTTESVQVSDQPVATPDSSVPVASESAVATDMQQPVASAPTPPSSSPAPIAQRTGGRFMDVVHPSSDMKAAPAIVVPSREGISIQPPAPTNLPAGTKAINDVIASPVKQIESRPVATDDEPVEPEANVSTEAEPASSPESTEPWSSPFLPDTQVEKRPLGGVPDTSGTGLSEAIAAELAKAHPDTEPTSVPEETVPSAEPASPAAAPTSSALAPNLESDDSSTASESTKPELDLQLAPQFDEKIVPAELDNDLVAIESGKASLSGETSEPVTAQDSTPSIAASAVLSTSSIPQQYSETASSGDASHTPIYDNEAAHQPLNHPAKKKKGWVLILFIVIIILVGGALGGAAYYFGLI